MFFHLCLVSVLFSAPSLLEIKFYRNFFSLVRNIALVMLLKERHEHTNSCIIIIQGRVTIIMYAPVGMGS